jgi:hypothetical protein
MNALERTVSAAAIVLAAFALSACGPRYDRLDITLKSSPPTATTTESNSIEIISGVAVVVHVEPISGSPTDYEETDEVSLSSENTGVLEVLHGHTEREFALVGVWPGETDLVVSVNGHVRDHIPFRCAAYEP